MNSGSTQRRIRLGDPARGCNCKTKECLIRTLDIAECTNEACPWSGKPVHADSLTQYDGRVVGFRNPGYRDRFDSAVRHFEEAKVSRSEQ